MKAGEASVSANVPAEEGVPVLLLTTLLAVAEWASGQNVALVVLTASVAGLLLLVASRTIARTERRTFPSAVRTALRDRTLRTAFLPQRDPDAAGRPRPRAPGLEITTV